MENYTLFGTNWYDLPIDIILMVSIIMIWFRWVDKIMNKNK